ncbi:acyltransferase [Methanomassiliicoccales archaeon LGM-RCC1]|nr:acyltransferase [Methanomassiliicoccales archaeon LGM-RCC1]
MEGATSKSKLPRNSNLEMARIIAMLMIIAFHQIIFTNGSFPDSPDISVLTYSFGCTLGLAGVVIFTLITGYFMANQKITVTKILKLLMEVWFFSITIRLCGILFFGNTVNEEYILDMLFPIISDEYWFISSYLILVLLSPLINLCLHTISTKAHLALCTGMLIVTWGLFSIHNITIDGAPVVSKHLSLITLYCIGAFISLHPQPIISSKKTSGFTLAYALIATLALSFAVTFLVYDRSLGWDWIPQLIIVLIVFIGGALLCLIAPKGKFFDRLFIFLILFLPVPLFLDLGYNDFQGMVNIYMGKMSGITLLLGFATFLYFLNKKPKTSKAVNWVAASMFGVYLIHENPIMHYHLWNEWLGLPEYFGNALYPLIVIAVTVVVFIVCVFIDKARIYLVFKPLDRYLQKFYAWAESLVEKVGKMADASLK